MGQRKGGGKGEGRVGVGRLPTGTSHVWRGLYSSVYERVACARFYSRHALDTAGVMSPKANAIKNTHTYTYTHRTLSPRSGACGARRTCSTRARTRRDGRRCCRAGLRRLPSRYTCMCMEIFVGLGKGRESHHVQSPSSPPRHKPPTILTFSSCHAMNVQVLARQAAVGIARAFNDCQVYLRVYVSLYVV